MYLGFYLLQFSSDEYVRDLDILCNINQSFYPAIKMAPNISSPEVRIILILYTLEKSETLENQGP